MLFIQYESFHAPKQTEDTYTVTLSAWNPIDSWVSSKPTLMEVLSSIGPITINDFSVINDAVNIIC